MINFFTISLVYIIMEPLRKNQLLRMKGFRLSVDVPVNKKVGISFYTIFGYIICRFYLGNLFDLS